MTSLCARDPGSAAHPRDPADRLVGVGAALRRLRAATTVEALLADAAVQLCERMGFDRTVIFRLQGHALLPESAYTSGAKETEARSSPLSLGPWLHESEALRRHRPALVTQANDDSRALQVLAGTDSYVIAPIVCHTRSAGLIHADRALSGEPLTELDRDAVAAFAEGLGCVLERAFISEALRRHTTRLVELTRATGDTVAELAEVRVGRPPLEGRGPAKARPEIVVEAPTELTRRELEVLRMLAEGETNSGIAERLIVSEGTVKTHVKHILRKLGVQNRSQAVACYFRSMVSEMPPRREQVHSLAEGQSGPFGA